MSVTLIERSARDRVLDRPEPGEGRRDLHEQVRAIDQPVEPRRLLERALAVVCKLGVHLERHAAVDTVRPLPGGQQEVTRAPHVLDGEREEDLFRVVLALENLAELIVVPAAGGQRLLEDRRVGGHPHHRVLALQPLELPRLEHLPREGVHPDAHAVGRKLVESAPCHLPRLPRRHPETRP